MVPFLFLSFFFTIYNQKLPMLKLPLCFMCNTFKLMRIASDSIIFTWIRLFFFLLTLGKAEKWESFILFCFTFLCVCSYKEIKSRCHKWPTRFSVQFAVSNVSLFETHTNIPFFFSLSISYSHIWCCHPAILIFLLFCFVSFCFYWKWKHVNKIRIKIQTIYSFIKENLIAKASIFQKNNNKKGKSQKEVLRDFLSLHTLIWL